MKKILLLLSVFVLFSCEQEDLNNLVVDSKTEVGRQAAVGSRAASTIADFNPINELEDIPVNIINVGNSKNKYLSCAKKGDLVDLYSKDDGSNRQRWYISRDYIVNNYPLGARYITLVGGNETYSNPVIVSNGSTTPILWQYFSLSGASTQFITIEGTTYYNLALLDNKFMGQNATFMGYLQPEAFNSTTLRAKSDQFIGLAQWEIKPVGDFEIIDIAYAPYTGGKLDSIPQKVSITTVDNSTSSIPLERNITETVEVTETSRFSKTEGVSFTTKTSTTKPLAGPGEPKENGGSVTIENSMTNSWSYTQEITQTKKSTRTDNFKVTVPPYVKYTVTTYINQYRMNIKYVATLRAANGKEFKVKGTWSGTQCYEMYQVVKEERTGRSFIVQGENANKY